MPDWIQVLIKTILLFFVILAFIRILGKRQISRVTPFQFVNYVIIAVLTALISVDLIPNLPFALMVLGAWIILPISLDYLSMKSKWAHDWINGKETILIKNGKIMEENLKQMRLTGEELLREVRSKNIFNLADVEFAVMESTGEMNVLLKAARKPLSSHDLGQEIASHTAPQTVILDGNIVNEALGNTGLNQGWLKQELESTGVSLDNVFIGQVDSSGDLYLDLFDDSVQLPPPRVKELLYANLEKCQADLMGFSLETNNDTAKKMYAHHADQLLQLMNDLEPYLLR